MRHKTLVPIHSEEDPEVVARKSPGRRRRLSFRRSIFNCPDPPQIQTLTVSQEQGRQQLEIEATFIDGRYSSMRYTGRTCPY